MTGPQTEEPLPTAEPTPERAGDVRPAEPPAAAVDVVDAAPSDAVRGAESAPAIELENHLRRALADLDSLRKRYAREVARERAAERLRVAGEWPHVLDGLDRALEHAGADPAALLEGVRAVRDQALSVLERLGYPRFEDVGEAFDPVRHEAVAAVDSAAPPGTVVAVARPGYGTGEAILRPASVVVSRGSGGAPQEIRGSGGDASGHATRDRGHGPTP